MRAVTMSEFNDFIEAVNMAIDALENLPSAQQCMTATSNTMVGDTVKIPVMDGTTERLPSAEQEIIRCKDCKHKPHTSNKYDYDNGDCGFEIIFPDYRCPCRCEDEYYNYIPDDDWYCGNAQRR